MDAIDSRNPTNLETKKINGTEKNVEKNMSYKTKTKTLE